MSAEPKLIDLAEKAFKTVLDADIHQDNKAGRILSAMAFLTAASASIFSKLYLAPTPSSQLQLTLFGIDWALFSFLIYMVCILIGASFYLAALGPSFNVPVQHGQGNESATLNESRLFFRSIAKLSSTEWEESWKSKNPPELQTELENNFIDETYLIAVKTQKKVDLMSLGNVLFRTAFIFLACLISSVFSTDLDRVRLIIVLSTVFLTSVLFVERYLAFSEGEKKRNLYLIVTIWTIIILVLLFIKLS